MAGAGLARIATLARHLFSVCANLLPAWPGLLPMPIRPIARRLLSLALWLSLSLPLLWPQPSWAASPEAAGSRGAQLFGQHCAGCHVNGGNIIRRSKTLKLAALQKAGLTTPQAIAAVATNGVGQMSGYAQVLGKGGPEAVGNYVWQQAQAGWPRK